MTPSLARLILLHDMRDILTTLIAAFREDRPDEKETLKLAYQVRQRLRRAIRHWPPFPTLKSWWAEAEAEMQSPEPETEAPAIGPHFTENRT